MSRAKKKFKVGDKVRNKFLLDDPVAKIRVIERNIAYLDHKDKPGARYSVYDTTPFNVCHLSLVKPKKPKPARVWKAKSDGFGWFVTVNGKMIEPHVKYMVKELNRLERKIARLEGR